MKRLINKAFILAASVLSFSCSMEEALDVPFNEAIVLDLTSGLTKAALTQPDTPTESYVHHIDVLIFDDSNGSPMMLKHYDRYVVNNSSQFTINAKRNSFTVNSPYHVYLVANSNRSKSDFAAVEEYGDFVGMKQTDELVYLTGVDATGAPEYFLMDAKATAGLTSTNTRVVLNDGDPSASVTLYANLRRAAAKIVINIKAGQDVDFTEFDQTVDGNLISDGGMYYIQNLPYQAFLLAEARADDTIDSDVIYLRNTDPGSDGHFSWNPKNDSKKASLVTYVYPNSWSSDIINRETCVVMNLPLVYSAEGKDPVEHHNSWYKIHMTGEKLFRRNNYYEVNVEINRPGATSVTTPKELDNVFYSVDEWSDVTVNVGGNDKPSYLQLNEEHIDIYNVNTDDSTLEFASSSPIASITLNEAYYINYLGNRVNVSDKNRQVYNAIKATAEAGVLNGGITIYSPFIADADFKEESHSNAIRYMKFTVKNQDGKTCQFTVNQYPTLYITHEMGKYSYRSDFAGTNYMDGVGSQNISGASWTGSGWSYSSTASSSVFFGSKVALGSEGNYTINYAYFRNSTSTNATTSVFSGLNNPRMYHVNVTASSSEYTVAKPRLEGNYTEGSAANARLVSPSFMAASQLGATQRLTGGVEQAKAHCEQYIEVTADGKVYSDWRLPTAAEIDIIIKHQEVSDAMATILTESAYYCAYNPDNGGYTRATGKGGSTIPVRCVRDAYDVK